MAYEGLASLLEGLHARADDKYAQMRGTVGPDYDYSKAGLVVTNGHSSDAGKLPNHPTFSTESAYHSERTPGGVWGYGLDGQAVSYTPSIQMMQDTDRMRGLAKYMADVEPGIKLLKPIPYKEGN